MLEQSTLQEDAKEFYYGKPLTSVLQLDLAPAKLKKGGFKLAAFGKSMTAIFGGNGAEEIVAKRIYHTEERVVEANGQLVTKQIDVPYDGEKQAQHLWMEIACLVWAQALLDMVYEYMEEEAGDLSGVPFFIPRFRFVQAALAVEQNPSGETRRKAPAAFLLEEVIDAKTEGPFRKYLNNVSPVPLTMESKEDEKRALFLAFSQHVQYWRTKKQVFVSDYQGKQK